MKPTILRTCENCRYYMTNKCHARKHEGMHPGPHESCHGWREMTLLDHERLEDARMTAADIRKEMREAKG